MTSTASVIHRTMDSWPEATNVHLSSWLFGLHRSTLALGRRHSGCFGTVALNWNVPPGVEMQTCTPYGVRQKRPFKNCGMYGILRTSVPLYRILQQYCNIRKTYVQHDEYFSSEFYQVSTSYAGGRKKRVSNLITLRLQKKIRVEYIKSNRTICAGLQRRYML